MTVLSRVSAVAAPGVCGHHVYKSTILLFNGKSYRRAVTALRFCRRQMQRYHAEFRLHEGQQPSRVALPAEKVLTVRWISPRCTEQTTSGCAAAVSRNGHASRSIVLLIAVPTQRGFEAEPVENLDQRRERRRHPAAPQGRCLLASAQRSPAATALALPPSASEDSASASTSASWRWPSSLRATGVDGEQHTRSTTLATAGGLPADEADALSSCSRWKRTVVMCSRMPSPRWRRHPGARATTPSSSSTARRLCDASAA